MFIKKILFTVSNVDTVLMLNFHKKYVAEVFI